MPIRCGGRETRLREHAAEVPKPLVEIGSRPIQGGELRAFRHRDFWACMDTYKDTLRLNDLWASGRAPWNTWD